MKKAILAVSYGTTHIAPLKSSVEATENAFREAFPDIPVFRAFSGKRILDALRNQGIAVDSPEEALSKLAKAGYDEILLQPTHIIGGKEYEKIRAAADLYRSEFNTIRVGDPLLNSDSDMETLCRFFARIRPTDSDALVLMGHGSEHYANRLYSDFYETCRRLHCSDMFIATLERKPDIEDIISALKTAGCRSVTIAPLLFAAGDHACRDMAGSSPESWKSRLDNEGFQVTAIIKGLGEYAEIREIYTTHLRSIAR